MDAQKVAASPDSGRASTVTMATWANALSAIARKEYRPLHGSRETPPPRTPRLSRSKAFGRRKPCFGGKAPAASLVLPLATHQTATWEKFPLNESKYHEAG